MGNKFDDRHEIIPAIVDNPQLDGLHFYCCFRLCFYLLRDLLHSPGHGFRVNVDGVAGEWHLVLVVGLEGEGLAKGQWRWSRQLFLLHDQLGQFLLLGLYRDLPFQFLLACIFALIGGQDFQVLLHYLINEQ